MDFDAEDLYIIEVINKDMTIKEVLIEHERELSMAIVKKICYAMDNNLKKINIARIITDSIAITLHTSLPSFQETLETNLQNLIKHEEYEMCVIGKKHLDMLKEKPNRKYLNI
jgi:hypothetical protein